MCFWLCSFILLPVKNLWKLNFFQNIFEILSFWKFCNTPKMYSTQKLLFIESLLQVFASVCPPNRKDTLYLCFLFTIFPLNFILKVLPKIRYINWLSLYLFKFGEPGIWGSSSYWEGGAKSPNETQLPDRILIIGKMHLDRACLNCLF